MWCRDGDDYFRITHEEGELIRLHLSPERKGLIQNDRNPGHARFYPPADLTPREFMDIHNAMHETAHSHRGAVIMGSAGWEMLWETLDRSDEELRQRVILENLR